VTLIPLGAGLLASIVAISMVAAWVAIGIWLVPGLDDDDDITAPAAILIGSGVTSFVLAVLTAWGMVRSGTAVTAGLAVLILAMRWKRAGRILASALAPLRILGESRVAQVSLACFGAVLWVSAISPPRSADAMRYHLAHIRQIITDGAWQPIADYHYALPFGWTLSFLPFEMIGLPQGSQLLGTALFVILLAGVARVLRRAGASGGAIGASVLLLLHPAVLRAFSEAGADPYALFAVFTIAALLMRLRDANVRDWALLGFASWIGMQSRYQLIAAGIAATVVAVVVVARSENRGRKAVAFIAGAFVAVVLASPFYFVNARFFGNPVWPLLINPTASHAAYADVVALSYTRSLSGSFNAETISYGLRRLVTTPFLIPMPVLVAGIIAAAVVVRQRSVKAVGWFGAVFVLLWLALQPLLYPRFILLMVPVAVLAAGLILSSGNLRADRAQAWFGAFARAGMMVAAIASIAVSTDSIRYVVTGDARTYHRFTWFYPVYQWVNRSTPADARFLVVVSSGHSYYLERPYRRADPWLSGVVDWRATLDSPGLEKVLEEGRYSYVIYEDRDWSGYGGGKEMQRAVRAAIATGELMPIRSFDERLYTSRVGRMFRTARVYVLERRGGL
jgi:hypothetical protein